MTDVTPNASVLDRVSSAAPAIALIGLGLVAALPVLSQALFIVPVAGPTPFLAGVGTVFAPLGIVAALAALVGGVITVERHPRFQLVGAGAALVGGVWLTHLIVEQAGIGAFGALQRVSGF